MPHYSILRLVGFTWLLRYCLASAAIAATSIGNSAHPYQANLLNTAHAVVENADKNDEDPITSFRLMYPTAGAVETIPLEFRIEVGADSLEGYKSYCGDKLLCVELKGEANREKCTPLANPSIIFDTLPTGNFTTRASITDVNSKLRYHQTSDTTFSVVSKEALAAHIAGLMETTRETTELPKELNLLEWARQRQHLDRLKEDEVDTSGTSHVNSTTPMINGSDTLLVIGIKSAVVENFKLRQAIRETWASASALPHDVKVFFVGCVPSLTNVHSAGEREQIRNAINLEKQTYGDLLTDELHCEDSYADLPSKVKEFLRFATQTFPQTPFAMIADDDIYLKADQLADKLRKKDHSQRLYIGQVWDVLFGRRQAPVRDATHRYFLPEDSYSLQSFPPFAFGPHYLLSMNCARFIAKNSERLRGLGAVDDASVALWLLAMQVHVEHTPAFSSLRIRACKDGLTSIADLSPFGIRSIHRNLVGKRKLCFGFDRMAWLKLENIDENEVTPSWDIEVHVHDLNTSKHLEVTSFVSVPDKASIKLTYFPSAESLTSYTQRMCAQVHTLIAGAGLNSLVCSSVALELRARLQQQLQITETGDTNRAFLELWRYNLFVADPDVPPLIIVYANHAGFASVVLECLFVSVYEHHKRPILVMPERILRQHYGVAPVVFVFSIADAGCEPIFNPTCQQAVADYTNEYSLPADVTQGTHSTAIMMISGEPTDTRGLDERVLLLSTISSVTRKKHAYLNVASTSFGERLGHPPTALLSATTKLYEQEKVEGRRFCAYLYARCDRPQREYMFDVLNAMEPVDALGICAGSSRLPNVSYATSRYSTWYNDDAATTFQRYKFVIAFENSGASGYVTEKLVNPFLAGSIPIYFGNSTTVSRLFNRDSFIDCGRFDKLRDCASYVMKVHKSPELYARMRHEPPIRNISAFNEAFSWHPSVPSRALADKVARLLSINNFNLYP